MRDRSTPGSYLSTLGGVWFAQRAGHGARFEIEALLAEYEGKAAPVIRRLAANGRCERHACQVNGALLVSRKPFRDCKNGKG